MLADYNGDSHNKRFLHIKQPTLGWKKSYISNMTYNPSKLHQADLVFGLQSEFVDSFCTCQITSLYSRWHMGPG